MATFSGNIVQTIGACDQGGTTTYAFLPGTEFNATNVVVNPDGSYSGECSLVIQPPQYEVGVPVIIDIPDCEVVGGATIDDCDIFTDNATLISIVTPLPVCDLPDSGAVLQVEVQPDAEGEFRVWLRKRETFAFPRDECISEFVGEAVTQATWEFRYEVFCNGVKCGESQECGTCFDCSAADVDMGDGVYSGDLRDYTTPCGGGQTTQFILVSSSNINSVNLNPNGNFSINPDLSACGTWEFVYVMTCDGVTCQTGRMYGTCPHPICSDFEINISGGNAGYDETFAPFLNETTITFAFNPISAHDRLVLYVDGLIVDDSTCFSSYGDIDCAESYICGGECEYQASDVPCLCGTATTESDCNRASLVVEDIIGGNNACIWVAGTSECLPNPGGNYLTPGAVGTFDCVTTGFADCGGCYDYGSYDSGDPTLPYPALSACGGGVSSPTNPCTPNEVSDPLTQQAEQYTTTITVPAGGVLRVVVVPSCCNPVQTVFGLIASCDECFFSCTSGIIPPIIDIGEVTVGTQFTPNCFPTCTNGPAEIYIDDPGVEARWVVGQDRLTDPNMIEGNIVFTQVPLNAGPFFISFSCCAGISGTIAVACSGSACNPEGGDGEPCVGPFGDECIGSLECCNGTCFDTTLSCCDGTNTFPKNTQTHCGDGCTACPPNEKCCYNSDIGDYQCVPIIGDDSDPSAATCLDASHPCGPVGLLCPGSQVLCANAIGGGICQCVDPVSTHQDPCNGITANTFCNTTCTQAGYQWCQGGSTCGQQTCNACSANCAEHCTGGYCCYGNCCTSAGGWVGFCCIEWRDGDGNYYCDPVVAGGPFATQAEALAWQNSGGFRGPCFGYGGCCGARGYVEYVEPSFNCCSGACCSSGIYLNCCDGNWDFCCNGQCCEWFQNCCNGNCITGSCGGPTPPSPVASPTPVAPPPTINQG